MNKVSINVKVNSNEKKEAEEILENLGISMSTAINMYIIQIAKQRKIPFDITTEKQECEIDTIIKHAIEKHMYKTYDEFYETEASELYAVSEDEVIYYNGKYNKKYKAGDIVFTEKYKYKNGTEGKNHLFVIIDKAKAVDITFFGFLLSSNIKKETYKYNVKIEKNEINRLKKDSIVKCDDLIMLKMDNIKFKIGSVSKNELETFKKIYAEFFKDCE